MLRPVLTRYRAQRNLQETIKLLPVPPEPDLIPAIECRVLALGAIHPLQSYQAAVGKGNHPTDRRSNHDPPMAD
jgi:hypothetical protein